MALRYMQFNVPVVFDFLEKHRHVLTVRGYDYHTEFAKVEDLDATIQRVKVCEVKKESDLNGFVALSGFKTTREWWKQINIFCKGRKWLYRVTIIDDGVIDAQERDYEEREHRRAHNLIDEGVPGFSVDRNAYRDENDPTTIEEYNIYDGMTHSLDVRRTPSLRDPALVDLTAAKAQAHRERLDADERATERKHERMREMYGEQMQAAPTRDTHDPEKIMRTSNAEQALKALCGNSYAA